MKRFFPFVLVLSVLMLSGCGINNIPTKEEAAKAKWSQVVNQYQRRADLIPNLVQTVKGYAKHEKETLTAVMDARAKATQITVDASVLSNPEAFQAYQQAQGQVSSTLSRLLAVAENYPNLKADQNFLALQSQIEGTENRIAVARQDFINAVQDYNTELKTFPGVFIKGIFYSDAKPMEFFTADKSVETAPKVNFE